MAANLITAIQTLGDFELTNITTVADITVLVGITGRGREINDEAAYVVYAEGVDPMERVDVPKDVAIGIIRLLIEGDECEGSQELYELCDHEQFMPKCPELRPIP